ncbi:hypothetical protein B0H14DRAFT_3504322 [Mycena olivaceomarginata]|nr:hypothetical protein B0H14DRAFT_3504322 [Mycena olivaceomarginata]
MKRSGGTGRQPAKRAKNVYLLQSFGHSLRGSQPAPAPAPPVARAGNLSSDRCRADVQLIPLRQNPCLSVLSTDSNDDAWVDVADPPDNDTATLGHDAGLPAHRKRKRKWYATTDNSLGHWVDNFRDAYLRVLMTREGTMGQNQCPCGRSGKYRCGECFGIQMYCQACIVEAHRLRPLCRIEAWLGAFFERRELRQLGLRVQLSHPDNQPCSRTRPGRHKFVVIAVNSFHHVAVDFCECRQNGSQFRWEQLLSYGWYPSTLDAPKSAVTISALKLFHAFSLQGKNNGLSFFQRVGQDYRQSRAFKFASGGTFALSNAGGMGNDLERLSSETHQGELAVDCLACPKVGVNLPEDWEKASPEERFLYTVYWAIGACFRLKGKNISSWSANPSIQDGWAYFTKWGGSEGYGEFVKTLGQQQEFVIPKLHILGHLRICQEIFSLLFTLGAAQADMEGIERIWSSSSLMGASTREMGPESRQDTLDDFWHFWNWNKVVGMGMTLRNWFLKASKELGRQQAALSEFTQEQEEQVSVWRKLVDDFESGASAVNPYDHPKTCQTLREVELELMREEQEREYASAVVREVSEGTMTEYLMLALEVEGQQRELAADLLANRSPTMKDLTDFVIQRTRMSRQCLQRKYSPGALQHLAMAGDAVDVIEPERIPLLLPSALSTAERLPPLSVEGLAAAEARLCDVQCGESLDQMRHELTCKINKSAATYRQARLTHLALIPIAGSADWRALHLGDVRMMEDEEEAKKRKQQVMKGKRKEAARENEYGEVVQGVCACEMWREELLLLQEEMVRCLRTLEWQAGMWDARAAPGYYQGKIVYLGTHLKGAMVFVARQAALQRMLATRFRRLWWCLTDQISGPEAGAANEQGNNDDSDGADKEDTAPHQDNPAPDEAAPEEMPGEMSTEEEMFRRAEMDALLALQSTSMGQYDNI